MELPESVKLAMDESDKLVGTARENAYSVDGVGVMYAILALRAEMRAANMLMIETS